MQANSLSKLLLKLSIILLTTLSAHNALALELGELIVISTLGEPLKAQLQISQHDGFSDAELLISQAPQNVYEKMGVDHRALYQELRFNTDETGLLTISSRQPIKEPYMNFILQFRWADGELYREVNILLDPAKH